MLDSLLQSLFGGLGRTLARSSPAVVARRPSKRAAATGSGWAALARPSGAHGVTVYDPKGIPLVLQPNDEVTRGGEGVIYRFAKNANILIKVCKLETLADPEKRTAFRFRLAAMCALTDCRKADFLAWPLMPVLDSRGEGVGFVMRKCTGRTLRALLAPRQVWRFFPGWNRIHVTRVALNLLDAVRMLARHRVLVNDFNPGNFLVDRTGTVRLIDCDSFQIPVDGAEPLKTSTFTPEFCAPELLLQPGNFDRPRTPEQVRFSLAVVIYMLLMSGLHPYARCGGGDPAENLKSGKCPLVKSSGVRMPVSWYKSASWLTPGLKDCFIRMFVDGFAEPSKRPLLEELRAEIENFIVVMRTSKNHNQRAILPATAQKRKPA